MSAEEANFNLIGSIRYVEDDFIAFYLNKTAHYGMLLNKNWLVVYFEFDPTAPWNETTGG